MQVDASAESGLPSGTTATRLQGVNRYQVNASIVSYELNHGFSPDGSTFMCGSEVTGTMTVATLSAKENVPIVLFDKQDTSAASSVAAANSPVYGVRVVNMDSMFGSALQNQLKQALDW